MEYENVFDQVLEHVMTVPDEDFADLTVSILAHLFGIDRFKLTRQFKRRMDMPLEAFLFKEKMSRAAFLLRAREDITVKEVSRKIGFCTCNYFIQKFKEHYGITPGRYREFKSSRLPK